MNELKQWLSFHRNGVALGAGSAVLALGLAVFGGGMASSGINEADRTQVTAELAVLQGESDTAQAALAAEHAKLLGELKSADAARVIRDTAAGTEALLAVDQDVFGHEIVVGTTGTAGVGLLSDFSVEVASITSLDYGYFGIATVQMGESREYWTVTYHTNVDGKVSQMALAKASAQTTTELNTPGEAPETTN